MSARAAGWLLLTAAVVWAAAVAGLAVVHGRPDPLLVTLAVVGLAAGVLVVVSDARRTPAVPATRSGADDSDR